MTPPEGMNVEGSTVCHLLKSLYGLKQAPRAWNIKLNEELARIGFEPSEADPAFFVNKPEDGNTRSNLYMLVYVDDILIAGRSEESSDKFKEQFKQIFQARDMGDAHYFLGMEIKRDRIQKMLALSQEK